MKKLLVVVYWPRVVKRMIHFFNFYLFSHFFSLRNYNMWNKNEVLHVQIYLWHYFRAICLSKYCHSFKYIRHNEPELCVLLRGAAGWEGNKWKYKKLKRSLFILDVIMLMKIIEIMRDDVISRWKILNICANIFILLSALFQQLETFI